jgi:hypothetical protein
MNRVEMRDICDALGERGLHELEELRDFICTQFQLETRSLRDAASFRYAQSIICRGEAEVFNVATPRYALRAYITRDWTSFVNARRLGVLCDQAVRWAPTAFPADQGIEKRRRRLWKNSPAWVLNKRTCVADSLLRIPPSDEYHILSVELGEANGEGGKVRGTPYVKPIALAGGMCAQAVCFMATSLLHEHAQSVHSIPDITAFATLSEDRARAVRLQGLNHRQLVEYFNHPEVGLQAMCQTAGRWYHDQKGPDVQKQFPLREETDALVTTVRSYLLSSMPVIATIDAGREAGLFAEGTGMSSTQSIYDRNKVPRGRYLSDPNEIRQRNHAICLVGCGMGSDNRRDFYFNDPMALPFMVASAEQLAHASSYVSGTDFRERYVPLLLPVTPFQVHLPLGDWHTASADAHPLNGAGSPGLLRIAQYWQIDQSMRLPVFATPYDPGEFRLCRIGDIGTTPLLSKVGGHATVTDWCERAKRTETVGEDHWCWIQHSPSAVWNGREVRSLWIWDAEIDPPTIANYEDAVRKPYLLAVFAGDLDGSEFVKIEDRIRDEPNQMNQESRDQVDATQPAPEAAKSREGKRLARSVITSFSTSGFGQSAVWWPKDAKFCDLYAFMATDEAKLTSWQIGTQRIVQFVRYTALAGIENWLRALPLHFGGAHGLFGISLDRRKQLGVPWPIVDARERMAVLSSRKGAACEHAQRAMDVFSLERGGPNVLAIASFVPGLASEGESGEKACRAVEFLIAMARELQGCGHPCRTVEIVAGSLFEGTWEGVPIRPGTGRRKKPVYLANVQSRSHALKCLCENLRYLNSRCASVGRKSVQLAVELEPGPFFVINKWPVLQDFCARMKGDADSFSRIGLNLDIAHWSLAQIKPETVYSDDAVRKRIIHSHISDHGRGHFADVALGRIHDIEHFKPWVSLLNFIAQETRPLDYPQYWGGVAIELEACRSHDLLVESVKKLAHLGKTPGERTVRHNVSSKKKWVAPSTKRVSIEIREFNPNIGRSGRKKGLDEMHDLDIQEDRP